MQRWKLDMMREEQPPVPKHRCRTCPLRREPPKTIESNKLLCTLDLKVRSKMDGCNRDEE